MPVWLTPAALLLVYVYAVVAAYELAFIRMRGAEQEKSLWRQRLGLILRGGIWLPTLRHIRGDGAGRIARTTGFREAWHEAGSIRRDRRAEAEAVAAAERRLVENAGVSWTSSEYNSTSTRSLALECFSVSQMGHYRNGFSGRADLVPILDPSFARDGLLEPSGTSAPTGKAGSRTEPSRGTGSPSARLARRLISGWMVGQARASLAEWDHWGGGELP